MTADYHCECFDLLSCARPLIHEGANLREKGMLCRLPEAIGEIERVIDLRRDQDRRRAEAKSPAVIPELREEAEQECPALAGA